MYALNLYHDYGWLFLNKTWKKWKNELTAQ